MEYDLKKEMNMIYDRHTKRDDNSRHGVHFGKFVQILNSYEEFLRNKAEKY